MSAAPDHDNDPTEVFSPAPDYDPGPEYPGGWPSSARLADGENYVIRSNLGSEIHGPARPYFRPDDTEVGPLYRGDQPRCLVLPAPPRRRWPRAAFWWFFAAVQAAFAGWLIAGIAAVQAHGGIPAFCGQLGGGPVAVYSCSAAADNVGGPNFVFMVLAWLAADVLLGVGYGAYRLARRP